MKTNKVNLIDPRLTTEYQLKQIRDAGSVATKTKKVLDSSEDIQKANAEFLDKPNRFVEQMKDSLKKLNIL